MLERFEEVEEEQSYSSEIMLLSGVFGGAVVGIWIISAFINSSDSSMIPSLVEMGVGYVVIILVDELVAELKFDVEVFVMIGLVGLVVLDGLDEIEELDGLDGLDGLGVGFDVFEVV